MPRGLAISDFASLLRLSFRTSAVFICSGFRPDESYDY